MQLLIPILVFVAVIAVGGGVILAVLGARRSIRSRLLHGQDDTPASSEEHRRRVMRAISHFGNAFSLGRSSSSLRAQLSRAGYYGNSVAATYIGLKLLLLAVGLALAGTVVFSLKLSLATQIYVTILGGAMLFFMPNVVVRSRCAARRREVRESLPDAVDLLEVCVSSGMGLDTAWNSVGDEVRGVSPVMADEMALTNLEMQLGAPRADAMRNLARRTGADEFTSLVALLVQSERFGTSISDALATFASSMRESRSQRAEEGAEKMAVKLLFPLVLFIFPVMLIVMAGPAALTLFKILTG